MREIKFRAWNKSMSKMIDLKQVTPLALDAGLKQDGLFLPFSEEFELMQFTGLYDKNGVEVYEGDILRSAYNGFHAVYWNQRSGHWGIDHKNNCCRPWRGPASGHIFMEEMVGNICENPDLLEKA